MNILPKTTKDFASKEYWDKFFKQRKESFEWYGDYQDLKPILLSYLKPEDKLLIIGCGNSSLSVDLFDDGYCNNTSIDISQVVIDFMIAKYKNNQQRQKLIFECMDMLKMKYSNESFNIVIDKGTLDAISSDQNIDHHKMFLEISRVLNNFGRYVCVTLLQEHVIKLLSWFLEQNNWICRVHRCFVRKEENNNVDVVNFPVFIVVFIKLKMKLPESYIELSMNGDKNFQKYKNIDEFSQVIKSSQNIEFLKYFIRQNKINDDDFYIELFDESNISESRYMLYFVQRHNLHSNIRCSVFIVPQGREHEWLFSSSKGREELLKQCSSDRLIVVMLNRKHQYKSMEDIKNDLAKQITDFFPSKNSGKIMFLSIGDDIGERHLIWEGSSDFSGQLFVEDVNIDDNFYRRLVFSENRNIIQSEVRLKPKTSPKSKPRIDHEFLSCIHHQFIAAGLAIINKPYKESYNLLMIGLGGGCFINFLAHNLKSDIELKVTIVEIDPLIEQVATKYFDFKKFNNQKNVAIKEVEVIIEDGLKYIAKIANSDQKFDFIIFDVDSKNLNLGISCPPKEFVEDECLKQVEHCLTNDGFFILNLVARDEDIKNEVYNRLKELYAHSYLNRIYNDLNEIIFLSNADKLDWFQINDFNLRYDYIRKSCFHIEQLRQTYPSMCKKIQSLIKK